MSNLFWCDAAVKTLACCAVLLLGACGSHPPVIPDGQQWPGIKANGIAVSPEDGNIYITDDASNGVLELGSDNTFKTYAKLPASGPGQANSLSQLAFGGTAMLFVQRFGFGKDGAIFAVTRQKTVVTDRDNIETDTDNARQIPGTDPQRRRLGLAPIDGTHTLSSWFIKESEGKVHGGVSLVTYDPTGGKSSERDLVIGLGKPVGLAIVKTSLFIADQDRNAIYAADMSQLMHASAPAAPAMQVAVIRKPDLMAAGPDGTLYTKCNSSDLCAVDVKGNVAVIARDFHDARGVAVDSTGRSLYVVERSAGPAGGGSGIRVLPLH